MKAWIFPVVMTLAVGLQACSPEYVAPVESTRHEVQRFGIDAFLVDRYELILDYRTLRVEPTDMVFGSDSTIQAIELILDGSRRPERRTQLYCQRIHILSPDYAVITMQNPDRTASVDLFSGRLERGTYRVYFSVSEMFLAGEYPIEITVGEETRIQNMVMSK
jgi:hypothetical protein